MSSLCQAQVRVPVIFTAHFWRKQKQSPCRNERKYHEGKNHPHSPARDGRSPRSASCSGTAPQPLPPRLSRRAEGRAVSGTRVLRREESRGRRESGRPSCPRPRPGQGPPQVPAEPARPGLWGHDWEEWGQTGARDTPSQVPHRLISLTWSPPPYAQCATKNKSLYLRPMSHFCSSLGSLMQDGGMICPSAGSTHTRVTPVCTWLATWSPAPLRGRRGASLQRQSPHFQSIRSILTPAPRDTRCDPKPADPR